MPEHTIDTEKRNLNPALQPLADRLIQTYRLSLEKAVAHLSDPAQFPMPESPEATEHLFLRYLQKRPTHTQQLRRRIKEDGPEKARGLSALQTVDLKSRKAIHAQVEEIPLESKIDFAALMPPQAQTKSTDITMPRYSGVRLRLREVTVVDETNPEGGSDTIKLGGIATSFTNRTQKVAPFFVGEFDDEQSPKDKVKTFDKVLAEFRFDDDDVLTLKNGLELPVTWPREYNFVVILAEEDLLGNFSEELQQIYDDVKDKATKLVEDQVKKVVGELTEEAIRALAASIGGEIGGAVGSVAPVIGTIIGAVVGALVASVVAEIFEGFADDLFPPQTVTLSVSSPHHLFDVVPQGIRLPGHGGLYILTCHWEFFGKISTEQSEIRVKDTLGTFLDDPFVGTISDFTLLTNEPSLKKAIHKWKGI